MTQRWQRWLNHWQLLLAAAYLALIPVLSRVEDVPGVTYLLAGSAAACFIVWCAWRESSSSLGMRALLGLGIDAVRRLPQAILWLPLPVSLSWVAGMMARVPPLEADYYLAFGLWLVALLLIMAVVLVPELIENRRKLPQLVRGLPLWEVAAVAFITAAAFAVRFVLLSDEPGPFWQDEGGFSGLGLEVANGIRKNFFFMGMGSQVSDLYELTIAIPFKLFGPSILWARLPHVAIGTASVPLLYLMLREMFERRVALVGAAFLAVYHFHVHFSRIAFPNLYDTFWAILVLLFTFRAIRTRKFLDFALAGIATGLQFYFFSGARLLPVVVAILFVYMALKTRGAFVLKNFWGLGVLLAGFVVASLPAALFWDGNPGTLSGRFENQNIFASGWLDDQVELTGHSQLHVLWDQFQQSLGALVVYDDVFQHYNAGIPLLTGISSVFFVIGGVYALFHIYQPRFLALLVLLMLTIIFGGALLFPPVASQRYLATVPVSAAFVGLGVIVAADATAKLVPRWRWLAPAAIAGVVLLIAFVNLSFYFGTYLPSDNYGRGRHLSNAQVADYLESFDGSYAVYFFAIPGFNTRDDGMLFRVRDKVIVEVAPDGVMALNFGDGAHFVFASRRLVGEAAAALRDSRPNALFLVPNLRASEMLRIRETCPNGTRSEVFTSPNGLISYQWYEVLDAQACVERLEQAGELKEAG